MMCYKQFTPEFYVQNLHISLQDATEEGSCVILCCVNIILSPSSALQMGLKKVGENVRNFYDK